MKFLWADSMECFTYLRHIEDLLSDGMTRRFGQPFNGPIIHSVHWLSNHSITAKDQSRIHQFGKKVLPGLFLGYALYAGGIWKGDVLIADLEELETMDASEIYSKRLNAKEVIFPKQGEFIFPIADGRIKTLGGDQELRTSTLIRPRPIQGDGPKYIDVSRTTHTNLDVKQEKRIDDYWDIDGSRDLSDPWTGFTQFTLLDEKAPDGKTWSGVRLTRKQLTSRPDHLWPELWKSMGKHAKLKEKQKWSNEKFHLAKRTKIARDLFHRPGG